MVLMPADPCAAPLKSKNTTFPPVPKRGRVKAHIFESLAKTVVSAASNLIRNGGKTGSCSPSTLPTTPNSD